MGAVGANVTPAAVQKDYPFDPLRDYVPVAMVAEWSAILVVKKDLPVDDARRVRRLRQGAAGRAQLRHHRLSAASRISSARCLAIHQGGPVGLGCRCIGIDTCVQCLQHLVRLFAARVVRS